MASPGGLEAEQKWDVDPGTPLPVLLDIPGVERVAEPVREAFEAVYFDTATLALAARRITLRRRTGGPGHGWHLKLPAVGKRRQALGQPETVPEELLDHVLVYTRGEPLIPVARVGIERTTRRLYGPGGVHMAYFADDWVHAEPLHPPGPVVDWREWQIDVVHGTGDLVTAATNTLTVTGAGRSAHGSELARALGDAYPPEAATGTGDPRRKGPVIDVVTAYLGGQISDLFAQDPGVRLGSPDAVHRMRSSTRRLRSALATYRSIFTKPETGRLVKDLPPGFRNRTVEGPVEQELGTAYNAGYKAVLKTLETDRYYRLLAGLEHFRDHPPTTARALRPARKETARLVNQAAKRLDRAHRTAGHAQSGGARDAALHRVRKDAKRLRHAGESVAGIHGKRARKMTRAAHRIQGILGVHQDSVVARAFLDGLAADPALPETAALAYARIRCAEEGTARAAEKRYAKSLRKAAGLRLRH